jgi:chemotaxis protein MotB
MRFHRTILIAISSAICLAGCVSRSADHTIQELQVDNDRLRTERDLLEGQVVQLSAERDAARKQAAMLTEQAKGMSDQLRKLLKTGGLDPTVWDVQEDRLSLKQDIAFQLGSDQLSEQGEAGIRQLAEVLQQPDNLAARLIVVGHTCTTKVSRTETFQRFGDNWGLSAMRAAAVIRALQRVGIGPGRLQGRFFGEYQPRVPGDDADSKSSNRRVEIFLTI